MVEIAQVLGEELRPAVAVVLEHTQNETARVLAEEELRQEVALVLEHTQNETARVLAEEELRQSVAVVLEHFQIEMVRVQPAAKAEQSRQDLAAVAAAPSPARSYPQPEYPRYPPPAL